MGKIRNITHHNNECEIIIATHFSYHQLQKGCSIAHNGICLTVTDYKHSHHDDFTTEYTIWLSSETIAKTNVCDWQCDDIINCELALRGDSHLDGHFVLGHVDAIGILKTLEKYGESYFYQIEIPEYLMCFMAEKGSVALDGISLTINAVNDGDNIISLMIIPHTWQHTNLRNRHIGDKINIEIDPLARYAQRILHFNNMSS